MIKHDTPYSSRVSLRNTFKTPFLNGIPKIEDRDQAVQFMIDKYSLIECNAENDLGFEANIQGVLFRVTKSFTYAHLLTVESLKLGDSYSVEGFDFSETYRVPDLESIASIINSKAAEIESYPTASTVLDEITKIAKIPEDLEQSLRREIECNSKGAISMRWVLTLKHLDYSENRSEGITSTNKKSKGIASRFQVEKLIGDLRSDISRKQRTEKYDSDVEAVKAAFKPLLDHPAIYRIEYSNDQGARLILDEIAVEEIPAFLQAVELFQKLRSEVK
ncbi:hypothetical protein [Chroococcidiopsis sp.]|uniref:hypothetical protein n=1 Tax=Chroococcidiopsis sp. TaxID=3088168 RepID=UPI003F347D5E